MNAISPGAWGLDNRMTVVLFAGMGGGCDGLEDAGFHVHLAVNHDPIAIAVHKSRHPHTEHIQTDVFEVDPRKATKGRGVRFLHASPDCTHFSVAKGSKPVSKRRRSLAWVIIRWLGQVRPEVVTLENVREITTWGPLIAKRDKPTGRVLRLDGSVAAKGERVPVQDQWLVPDPRHKGRIWRAFCRHAAALGYNFEYRVINFANLGVATIRTRLMGVMRADGLPIVWPEQTHAPRSKAKALKLKPWVGADTIIDWSLPVKSIFNRKKPLADATMRRIARGVMRFVVESADPFIVPLCQTGGGTAGRSAREPLATLTTAKGGEHAIVAAHLTQFRTGATGTDMRQPLPAYTANSFHKRPGGAPPMGIAAISMVGLAHGEGQGSGHRDRAIKEPLKAIHAGGGNEALVAAFLAKHNTDVVGNDMREPVSALTTGGDRGQTQIAPVLASLRGSVKGGRDVREALPAQTADGNHELLILPFLQTYYGSGDNNHDARDPLHAVTVNDRHGLVTVEVNGQTLVITDICMRMLDPLEGARAHGFDPASLQHEIEFTDAKGRTVRRKPNKTEIGHLVGNSVPPLPVRLLAELNGHRELMVAAE